MLVKALYTKIISLKTTITQFNIMPKKKVKLDMSAIKKKLIEKTVKDPYWGTAGSHGGSVNVSDRH